VAALDDAVAAFNPTGRTNGKTIIRVHPCGLADISATGYETTERYCPPQLRVGGLPPKTAL
jgi:hypothetical protein